MNWNGPPPCRSYLTIVDRDRYASETEEMSLKCVNDPLVDAGTLFLKIFDLTSNYKSIFQTRYDKIINSFFFLKIGSYAFQAGLKLPMPLKTATNSLTFPSARITVCTTMALFGALHSGFDEC